MWYVKSISLFIIRIIRVLQNKYITVVKYKDNINAKHSGKDTAGTQEIFMLFKTAVIINHGCILL